MPVLQKKGHLYTLRINVAKIRRKTKPTKNGRARPVKIY